MKTTSQLKTVAAADKKRPLGDATNAQISEKKVKLEGSLRKPAATATAKPGWGQKTKPAPRKAIEVSAPTAYPKKVTRAKVNTAEPDTSLKKETVEGSGVVYQFVRDIKTSKEASLLETEELLGLRLTGRAKNVCGGSDDRLKVEERIKLGKFLQVTSPTLLTCVFSPFCSYCRTVSSFLIMRKMRPTRNGKPN